MIKVRVTFTNREGKEETAEGRIVLNEGFSLFDGDDYNMTVIVLNDGRIVTNVQYSTKFIEQVDLIGRNDVWSNDNLTILTQE